jgi:hypothetical protein
VRERIVPGHPGARERTPGSIPPVTGRSRFALIVLLFVAGFGMVALAAGLRAWWPLFLMPLPHVLIASLVVHADDGEADAASPT